MQGKLDQEDLGVQALGDLEDLYLVRVVLALWVPMVQWVWDRDQGCLLQVEVHQPVLDRE